MKLTKAFILDDDNSKKDILKEHKGLNYIEAQQRTKAILATQTDFSELYKVIKSDLSINEKEKIITDNQNLKIQFYNNRINSRHKGNKLADFMGDKEIILKGINYGKFENIEQNLYYCLDNVDLILNGFLAEPLIYRIPTKHNQKQAKQILKELAPYKKIDTNILKKYNQLQAIPPSDFKANTALLYALFTERDIKRQFNHKTQKYEYFTKYKYRDFIISIIQEFIYSNFTLNHNHRTSTQPLNFYINTKDKTQKTNQNLFKNSDIAKLILNNFLPYRNANF
ncbi:hypothetical protein [Campylobacter sp. JMF_08 NE1]|uniref:hypothetical protein n=1 Tax=Campylobacter sp. JMF_08 NE1 TaxID=2983821 RepID=UPI0022E9DDF5|nr:hypothetical protein [Campylobacter sp. JMF_08 NE1]MDA3047499.1 hypothetical protein [Campylobacter sp. JMF_08 NE1]